jgi:glycosyltransferase involved in cell wall biosynthesis
MKILALFPHMGGSDYHRLYIPMKRMQIDNPDIEVSIVQGRSLPDMDGYDLVIFNRYLYQYHYPIIQKLAELDIPYILDLDDHWKLPKYHYATKFSKEVDLPNAVKDAIRYAAGVTCPTENLASEIRPLNHNVCILPNVIEWTDAQWAVKKTESKEIRFGWVGGISHENDLHLISEAVEHTGVNFTLCGVTPHPIWDRIRNRFPNATIGDGLPVNEYGVLYSNIDVLLCPLEATKWNSMKSELKVLESAEYNIPVIASNVYPYKYMEKNMGVRLVENNTKSWVNTIEFYLNNPNKVAIDGKANYEYCHAFYNIEDVNEKRLNFFKRICKSAIKDRH